MGLGGGKLARPSAGHCWPMGPPSGGQRLPFRRLVLLSRPLRRVFARVGGIPRLVLLQVPPNVLQLADFRLQHLNQGVDLMAGPLPALLVLVHGVRAIDLPAVDERAFGARSVSRIPISLLPTVRLSRRLQHVDFGLDVLQHFVPIPRRVALQTPRRRLRVVQMLLQRIHQSS